MSNDILSVDLGGTNMRVAVVDEHGEIRYRANEPTPRDARCPEALEQLMASVRDQAGGRGTFDAIVVGVPGRVDYCAGQLEHAPNLPSTWVTELSEEHLATYFDAPVFLANDADLAAVGETTRWFAPRSSTCSGGTARKVSSRRSRSSKPRSATIPG